MYIQLRTAILQGNIAEGSEINQVEVAESLGVSRVPVREALRRLQAEKLLVANPFQRFVVKTLSRDELLELFELREELEVFGLRRAVRQPKFVDSILPAARAAAAELDIEMSVEDWLQADRNFHRTLNGGTTAVSEVVDDIRGWIYRGQHIAGPDLTRRAAVLEEHRRIIELLYALDLASGEQVLREHVRATRRAITGAPDDLPT